MIETTVLDYLTPRLPEPVLMEVPSPRPARYVTIEKTGGGAADRLLEATLAIQSVAPSLYEAAALNERVKGLMQCLTALPNVFRCDCETDYNFTDTRTKERRYQAVYHIFYMEE